MKKIAVVLAATVLVFISMSCTKKEAKTEDLPDDMSMFMTEEEEDDGLLHLEYEYVGVAQGDSYTNLPVSCKIIANKDYSKPTPVDVYCGDEPAIVKFAGEECVMLSPNADGAIRVIWLFDSPIDASSVSKLKFSVGGHDVPPEDVVSWNIALLYNDEITEGEHSSVMYIGPMTIDGFTTTEIDLATGNCVWGNAYKPEGQFFGIQIYCGGKDPIFIKDLELK